MTEESRPDPLPPVKDGEVLPTDKGSWFQPGRIVRLSIPLIGLLIGVISLRGADPSKIGSYGLIQALPAGYYIGLGAVFLAFPLTWRARGASRLEFPVAIIAQVILLHGAPAIVEPLPRFPSAWLLAGFTDFVGGQGRVLPLVDARFSWPSMFSGVAILARAGGLPTATVLLKWWPVALNLACIPPLYLLAKTVLGSPKRALLVAWLFPLANWVGQDYFSPQSVAFLLYLVLLCVVLGPLGAKAPLLWRRARVPEGRAPAGYFGYQEERTLSQTIVLFVTLLVLVFALATGHQLTPIFAVVTVMALSLSGRTSLRVFVFLMGTITLAYICYGAFAFWAGHTTKVFGGLGQIDANVASNVSSRLTGSHAHRLVTRVRLLNAASIWGLGTLGLIFGRRLKTDRLSAAVMMFAPFSILLVQSYGGEGGLRIYLISLPGILCLVALLLTAFRGRPDEADPTSIAGFRPGLIHATSAFILPVMLVPLFLLSRWGNEAFEQTRPNDLATVQALYRLAPPGATLLAMDQHLPWRFTAVDKYDYRFSSFNDFVASNVSGIQRHFKSNPHGGFIVITTGQIEFGIQTYGLAPDWAQASEKALTSSGLFKLVYSNPDGRIYQYQGPT
jgi:hypothetical protein